MAERGITAERAQKRQHRKANLLAYDRVGPLGSVDPKYDVDAHFAISYRAHVYCLIPNGSGWFYGLSFYMDIPSTNCKILDMQEVHSDLNCTLFTANFLFSELNFPPCS